MAISRTAVGTAISATGSAVTSLVYTLTGSIPQGATILLGYAVSATGSAATATDSSGNTYTSATSGNGTDFQLGALYADNALALVAGDTITLAFTSSTNSYLIVSYLQGNSVVSLITPSAIASAATTTAVTSTAPATNATNCLPSGGLAWFVAGFSNTSNITETIGFSGGVTTGQNAQANGSSKTIGVFEGYEAAAGSPPTTTATFGHTDQRLSILGFYFRPACTWFYDYEGGSDFNGGDSFATLASGTAGVGAGTTAFVLDVGSSADSTWLGRRINISKTGTGLQGLYLIVAVTDGTHVTLNAGVTANTGYIWNVGGRFATPRFGGNVSQNSPTTQSSGAGFQGTGFQAGDTARLMASTDAQDTTTTAAWTSNTNATSPTTACKSIVLTAAQNLTVDTGDAAWTASANVTCTASTTLYVGGSNTHSSNIAVATAFTTGLAAFKATGSLTISSYQQLCFWIRTTVAIAAGQYSLRLCSDTAGVTTVETIGIPAIPTANQWTPVVVDKGSAFTGTAIQSVALYVDSDQGAVTINLCGIFVAKAPGATALTLHSLVGKNTTGEPDWYAVRAIEGTSVYLDTDRPASVTGNNQANQRGYFGTTETVELYKLKPIVFTVSSTSANTFQFAGTVSGVAGQLVNAGVVPYTISGGWDRTAMSSQSGFTWMTFTDGSQNGFGASTNYQTFDHLGAARANVGIGSTLNDAGISLGDVRAACCATGVQLQGTSGCSATTIRTLNCNTGITGVTVTGGTFDQSSIGTLAAHNCVTGGVVVSQNAAGLNFAILGSVSCCNNGTTVSGHGMRLIGSQQVLVTHAGTFSTNFAYGISVEQGGDLDLYGGATFSGNGSGSINATAGGECDCVDATSSDSTVVHVDVSSRVTFTRYGGTATDHRQYCGNGTIQTDTTTRHTATGASWKVQPTSARDAFSGRPLRVKIASVALKASEARTISCYVQRNAGGITSQLCIPGGQAPGLSTSDAVASSTQINTWEQLSLSITPTVDCVVDVCGQAYGGSALAAWFQDVAVA